MADFALRWSNNYQLPAPLKDVKFEFLGVFLTSTHAPTKRPASRPLRRSHSALWTSTSAELPPKSNPVTDWHRQAGTRLSLGPRTHRAQQADKSARPALHLTENEYICSLIE